MHMYLRAFVAAMLPILAARLTAQSAAPPIRPEVQMALRCPASPCRFRQGEVISIDLVFTAATSGYGVLLGYTERLIFELDRFTVMPSEGASDPQKGCMVAMGVPGGAYSLTPKPLGSDGTPIVLSLELNQWIRFDKPGKYRVTARSSRARMIDPPVFPWLRSNGQIDLVSSPVEVEIVPPDAEWQREQLARIRGQLPITAAAETESQRAAVRALAYLDTDDAMREIGKRIPGDAWPYPADFVEQYSGYLIYWELARLELLRHVPGPGR